VYDITTNKINNGFHSFPGHVISRLWGKTMLSKSQWK